MPLYIGNKKVCPIVPTWRGFWSVTIKGFRGTIIDCGTQKTIGEDSKVTFRFAEPGTYTFIAMKGDKTQVLELELVEGEYFVEERMYLGEFIPLEYIESTGTQYIDTGIRPIDITEMIADFAFTNANLRSSAIVAAVKLSDNLCNYVGEHSVFNGFGENWGSTSAGYTRFGVSHDTNRHTWKVDTTTFEFYLDNIFKATQTNGQNIDTTFTIASTGFLTLQGTTGRFYSVKFSMNDTILRDFVPAKRTTDDEVGMFDLVTGQFFANSGEGDFIPGPEV